MKKRALILALVLTLLVGSGLYWVVSAQAQSKAGTSSIAGGGPHSSRAGPEPLRSTRSRPPSPFIGAMGRATSSVWPSPRVRLRVRQEVATSTPT